MSWPTPQDYNEALQHPLLCFADADLQTARPDCDPSGLPSPISGNYASVYHMRSGRKVWAVKCFYQEVQDRQDRYTKIDEYLRSPHLHLPYTVEFRYLARGVQVRPNAWYPIVKMEWVEGELLHKYIAAHLHDQAALATLANRWMAMVGDLEKASIAHGDLQHDNVLVVNGGLKLVDYDGMFVPGLKQASGEGGHYNYQHPRRNSSDFGPRLDRFSAWVIYVSLVAVSVDPGLWQKVRAGDDCLLFREDGQGAAGHKDFSQPELSPIFSLLQRHSDARLRALGAKLRSFLDLPSASRVPALSSVAPSGSPTPAQGLPDWVKDQFQQEPAKSGLPDWIDEQNQTTFSSISRSSTTSAMALPATAITGVPTHFSVQPLRGSATAHTSQPWLQPRRIGILTLTLLALAGIAALLIYAASNNGLGTTTFDDGQAGVWWTGHTANRVARVASGMYIVQLAPNQEDWQVPATLADGIVDAQVAVVASSGFLEVGVMSRYADNDGYVCRISSDAEFECEHHSGSGWAIISDWQASKAIKTGGWNTIALQAQGNSVSFLVNDQSLASFVDASPTSGKWGVGETSGAGSKGTALYNYIQINKQD